MNFSDFKKKIELRESSNGSGSFLYENTSFDEFKKIADEFILFCKNQLKLDDVPDIEYIRNLNRAKEIAAFGNINHSNQIKVNIQNRHPMDILRTLSHELVHYKQHLQGKPHKTAGAGSPTENEANKIAGTLIRKFGSKHSEYFKLETV